MMKRVAFLVVACLLAIGPSLALAAPALPAWRMEPPFSTETASMLVDGRVHVTAEIADTFETRARGLGDRDGLLPGWGMLFVSPKPAVQNFWMKGMRFCLDIVWIEGGQITGAAENVCPQPGVQDSALTVYSSDIPVTYVLEMPAHWMRDNGLHAGSTVAISLPPSS
jgi:uncharacterized membrane protein (UPF0127 family)